MRGTPLKAIKMATKRRFCAIICCLTEGPGVYSTRQYTTSMRTTSFRVDAIYLGCHLFLGEVRIAPKGQSLETGTRSKFVRTSKAPYNIKRCRTVCLCLVESACASKRRQTKQGHFMRSEKAQLGWYVHLLLQIWSGARVSNPGTRV